MADQGEELIDQERQSMSFDPHQNMGNSNTVHIKDVKLRMTPVGAANLYAISEGTPDKPYIYAYNIFMLACMQDWEAKLKWSEGTTDALTDRKRSKKTKLVDLEMALINCQWGQGRTAIIGGGLLHDHISDNVLPFKATVGITGERIENPQGTKVKRDGNLFFSIQLAGVGGAFSGSVQYQTKVDHLRKSIEGVMQSGSFRKAINEWVSSAAPVIMDTKKNDAVRVLEEGVGFMRDFARQYEVDYHKDVMPVLYQLKTVDDVMELFGETENRPAIAKDFVETVEDMKAAARELGIPFDGRLEENIVDFVD